MIPSAGAGFQNTREQTASSQLKRSDNSPRQPLLPLSPTSLSVDKGKEAVSDWWKFWLAANLVPFPSPPSRLERQKFPMDSPHYHQCSAVNRETQTGGKSHAPLGLGL